MRHFIVIERRPYGERGVLYALRTVKSELMKYVNRLKPIKSVIHFDMQIIYMLHTPYV